MSYLLVVFGDKQQGWASSNSTKENFRERFGVGHTPGKKTTQTNLKRMESRGTLRFLLHGKNYCWWSLGTTTGLRSLRSFFLLLLLFLFHSILQPPRQKTQLVTLHRSQAWPWHIDILTVSSRQHSVTEKSFSKIKYEYSCRNKKGMDAG